MDIEIDFEIIYRVMNVVEIYFIIIVFYDIVFINNKGEEMED